MNTIRRFTFLVVLVALLSFSAQLLVVQAASALTFTVTNTSDSGAGSLRQAIADANGTPGLDNINFNISGSGPHVINVESPITITSPVNLDATDGGGSTCATTDDPAQPNVQINFDQQSNSSIAFSTGSEGSSFTGFSLVNALTNVYAIYSVVSDVTLTCNYFQIDTDGSVYPDGAIKILSGQGASGFTVGGTSVSDRNYFAGNTAIDLTDDDQLIQNNYFGVTTDGSSAASLPGTTSWISTGYYQTLSNIAIRDNVLSNSVGNSVNGSAISIIYSSVDNLEIQGNYIGTDATGTTAIPNTDGYAILSHQGPVTHAVIGGSEEERNVISGNSSGAIRLDDISNSTVSYNYVGVAADGSPLGNSSGGSFFEGILSFAGANNHLTHNVVSNNDGPAIAVSGTGTRVQNNIVGLDPSANDAQPNTGVGVMYFSPGGDEDVSIGGDSTEGNIIANNVGGGIHVDSCVTAASIGNNTLTSNGAQDSGVGGSDFNTDFGILVGPLDNGDQCTSSDVNVYENEIVSTHGYGLVNTLGGALHVTDNSIHDSYGWGISVESASSVNVENNTVSSNGQVASDNGASVAGINVSDIGSGLIRDNTIENNFGVGIRTFHVDPTIYRNTMSGNSGIGVDINGDGVTSNDDGDSDATLNYPILRDVQDDGSITELTFDVDLQPGDYVFDICNNPSGQDASGYGECENYIAWDVVQGYTGGQQQLTYSIAGTGYDFSKMSMQASVVNSSDPDDRGRSSEFGNTLQLDDPPPPPPTPSADLTMNVNATGVLAFGVGSFPLSTGVMVCNMGGSERVESFVLDLTMSHSTVSNIAVVPGYGSASDSGSFNFSTMTWTGELDGSQCLALAVSGTVTGSHGQNVDWHSGIVSSVLLGGTSNVDPDSSNDANDVSIPIGDLPDLAMSTRLLTSGTITSGMNVSYELDLANVGLGAYNPGSDPVATYFVLPEGASFVNVTDPNPSDGLTLLGCQDMGNIHDMGASFTEYNGELIGCQYTIETPTIPAGQHYYVDFNMTASADFGAGVTQVLGVFLGQSEDDSLQFESAFGSGIDGFALGLNNVVRLTYDPGELTVTINRCAGQSAVTTIDSACFTVTFNKPVFAPSFTVDDLVLDGGGTVYSFVQDSSTQWTVRVTGMTLGGTLRLLLGPSSVTDLSAVSNGVQVLGENTVRFGVADSTSSDSENGTTSAGELPRTGTNVDWVTPLILLLGGYTLLKYSRRMTKRSAF